MAMMNKGRFFTQLYNLRQVAHVYRFKRFLCTEWKVLKNSSNLCKDKTDATYCALKVWSCNASGVPFTGAFINFGPEPGI